MFPLVVSTLRRLPRRPPRAVIQSENQTKTSNRRPWGCLVSIRAGRRRVRSGRQPVVKPRAAPRASETLPTTRRKGRACQTAPPSNRNLLGSATVTILCRPIREVRVARPRVRRDRLGAHASGEGFDETARRGVTCEDPAPVRSRPRWSRRIPTRIAHGIGHDHAWVFMDSIGNKAVNPKLAESAPNATYRRRSRRWNAGDPGAYA